MKKERDWESWIDQQIREAAERGELANLPGKGKPLNLESNPYASDQEMAYKVLKDAGFAPAWIELDKAIRGRLEKARATLSRAWDWYQARRDGLADRSDRAAETERERLLAGWRKAVAAFESELAAINRSIVELNLQVPSGRFQRPRVDAAREIEQLTGKQP